MSVVAVAASQDEALFRRSLETLPAAAYTCDRDGLITYFNGHALRVWGRAPKLNDPDDRFCGSFRLFAANDERPIAHDECWMALAIRNRREYLGQEIVVERPDKSRVTVLAYATPVLDEFGDVVAAVNMLVNISERKRLETLLEEARRTNDFYRAMLADALRGELAPMRESLAELEALLPGNPALHGPVAQLRGQMQQMAGVVDYMVDVKPRRPPADS